MKNVSFAAARRATLETIARPYSDGRVFVDFGGDQDEDVILHLSFRLVEGAVVANDRVNSSWGAEIAAPLEPGIVETVELKVFFGTRSARVFINGRTVLRLPADRFRLGEIRSVRLNSGMLVSTVRVNGEFPKSGLFNTDMRLAPSMLIEAPDLESELLQGEAVLEVEGSDASFACIMTPGEKQIGDVTLEFVDVQAVLPGLVWEGRAPDEPVVMRLVCGGWQISRYTLSREHVVGLIETLVKEKKTPEIAIFEALSIVEHVKYGGLVEALSPEAIAFVRKTLDLFDLGGFFELPADEAAAPVKLPAAAPAHDVVLSHLRESFAAVVRTDAASDPVVVLRELLAMLMPSKVKERLLIALTEYFCQRDKFDQLYELWIPYGGNGANLHNSGAWSQSLTLPFLFKLGHYQQISKALAALANERNVWIITPCISWTVKAALASAWQIGASDLGGIVNAYMALVESQASSYWSRAACVNLIDASVALLLHRRLFPAEVDARIVAFVLKCYGMSPVFWKAIDAAAAAGQALPAELSAGRAAFQTIRNRVEQGSTSTRQDVETALRFFAGCGNFDADRFRLEVLGAAGIIDSVRAAALPLIAEGCDPSEILLRHLAFPGARDLPADLSEAARRAVRERMGMIQLSPRYTQTVNTVRRAHALLAQLRAGGSDVEALSELDDVFAMLTQSAGEGGEHADLAIGVALYCDVLVLQRELVATKIGLFVLERMNALPEKEAKALRRNRMLRSVYTRFVVTAQGADQPMAASILSHLDQMAHMPQRLPEEPLPEAQALWASASSLFDTLVLVYSCRANLDTRVAEIRKSWLGRLAELGVPYLIVVGDGADEMIGDVLHVDAPDTYEGLPQKSVKMFQWVERHTAFAHVLKIDDDCFLDVDEFFFSLTYRKFNFYGRDLKRNVGTKPRAWHMQKAATQRARLELDKSPEPAVYADGGSGYTLSREAVLALTKSLSTLEGRRIAAVSYSEDKLIGDLLRMQNIAPQSEDYITAVLRTTHPGGRPVLQWETTFFPSLMSGVKLAHMDNADTLVQLKENYAKGALFPRRVWPTRAKVTLRTNSNGMVLESSEAQLAKVAAVPVAVAAVVRNELFMLPHFLEHYRKIGVTGFLIVDNCSDDGTLEYLLEQPDVAVFSADGSFRYATQGSDWKIAMLAQFRVGKWTLIADADELLVYRGYETIGLPDYLASRESDADAYLTVMLDMYPKGTLTETTFDSGGPFEEAGYVDHKPFRTSSLSRGTFSNRATRTSSLRHRLIPGSRPDLFVAEKVALIKYKPWMRFSVSIHYATEVTLAPEAMILCHFKYNSEFRSKAVREIKRGQYFNNAEEYKKYVEILMEGRDVIYDPSVSTHWRECEEIVALLGPLDVVKGSDSTLSARASGPATRPADVVDTLVRVI